MIIKTILQRSLQRYWSRVNFSSTVPDELVFFTNDIAVCWHPEPKFPYECSRPLPQSKPPPDSVLKIAAEDARKIYAPEKPAAVIADELAALTYTTKHKWFPRARDKRAKKTPPNRPYL